MLSKTVDIILHISNFLSNKEKIILSATSKIMNKLKYRFRYLEHTNYPRIQHLSYFDNFECISIFDAKDKIPKNVKFLHYSAYDTGMPLFVTHLYLFVYYNKHGALNIPQTVTHLMFSSTFDDTINFKIPTSVTHLMFDKLIKCNISSFVTHLYFGYHFNCPIDNHIPQSVTHLVFGRQFNQTLEGIPSTVIEIKISKHYNKYISDNVKSKIKIKDAEIDSF